MDIKNLPQDVKTYLKSGTKINSIIECATELVLNSLDAKSTSVAVRINLITFRIQVVDNGIGITQSNMKFVGIRYMTNKCQSLKDLEKIKRFGFRGEALASICRISRKVTVASRAQDVDNTYSKTHENSNWHLVKPIKQRPSQGTTITVEDFMYNLPVRQKRINPNLDLREIKQNLEALAVIHPHVSFNLRDDTTGRIIFQINKTRTVISALASICPNIETKHLIEVKVSKNKISVSGLIYIKSSANSKLQFIYVNKRPITSFKIQNLLNSFLRKSLIFIKPVGIMTEKSRHPVYIINIHSPCNEVDVTISPSKRTVEFKHWDVVLKCVEKAVTKVLKDEKLIDATNDAQDTNSPVVSHSQNQFGVSQIEGAVKSSPVKRAITKTIINESIHDLEDNAYVTSNNASNVNKNNENILVHADVHVYKDIKKRKKHKDNRIQPNKLELLPNNCRLKRNDSEESFDISSPALKDLENKNAINFKRHFELNKDDFVMKNGDESNIQSAYTKHESFTKRYHKRRIATPEKSVDLKNTNNPKIKTITKAKKKTYSKISQLHNIDIGANHDEIKTPKLNLENCNLKAAQTVAPDKTKLNSTDSIIIGDIQKEIQTQNLVLNSYKKTDNTSLNYTVNTAVLQNQEKGKDLIMDMFLKSTAIFPNEQPKISDNHNDMKTEDTKTTKANLVSLKIMSTTVITNSVVPTLHLDNTAADDVLDNKLTSKLENMVSKCVQTTMIEQQKEFNLNFVTQAELNTNTKFSFPDTIAENNKLNVTFSKYFKRNQKRSIPNRNDHHIRNLPVECKNHFSELPLNHENRNFNFDLSKNYEFNWQRPKPVIQIENHGVNKMKIPRFATIKPTHNSLRYYCDDFPWNIESTNINYLNGQNNFQKQRKNYFGFSKNAEVQQFIYPNINFSRLDQQPLRYDYNNCNFKSDDVTVPLYRSYNPKKFEHYVNNHLNFTNHKPKKFFLHNNFDKWHKGADYNTRDVLEEPQVNDTHVTANITKITFNSHLHSNNQNRYETSNPKSVLYANEDDYYNFNEAFPSQNMNYRHFPFNLDENKLQREIPANIFLRHPDYDKPNLKRRNADHQKMSSKLNYNRATLHNEERCFSPYFNKYKRKHTDVARSNYYQQCNQRNNVYKMQKLYTPNDNATSCVSPFFQEGNKLKSPKKHNRRRFRYQDPKFLIPKRKIHNPLQEMKKQYRFNMHQPNTKNEKFWEPLEKNLQPNFLAAPNNTDKTQKGLQEKINLFSEYTNHRQHKHKDLTKQERNVETECSPNPVNQLEIQDWEKYCRKKHYPFQDYISEQAQQKPEVSGKRFEDKLFTTKIKGHNNYHLLPTNDNRNDKHDQSYNLLFKKYDTEPLQEKLEINDFLQTISNKNMQSKNRSSIFENRKSKLPLKRFCTEPVNITSFPNDEQAPVKFNLFQQPSSYVLNLSSEPNKEFEYNFTTLNINKSSTKVSSMEYDFISSENSHEAPEVGVLENVINSSLCFSNFKPKLSSTHLEIAVEEACNEKINRHNIYSFNSDVIQETPTQFNYFSVPSLQIANKHYNRDSTVYHETSNQQPQMIVELDVSSLAEKCKSFNAVPQENVDLTSSIMKMSYDHANVQNDNVSTNVLNNLLAKLASDENEILNSKKAISPSNKEVLETPSIKKDWIQKTDQFGNIFYIHERTGMTSIHSPKQDFYFNLAKRYEFVPKGLSPILVETKNLDITLSPTSKKSLHVAIMESYENELSTIKWANYIDNCKDANKFFEELYREKAKQFECFVPNTSIKELPKVMLKLYSNLQAQSFTKDVFNDLQIIGQLDNKFIVALLNTKNIIILFDQHAVDERVRLEKLIDGYKELKNGNLKFKSTKCDAIVTLPLPESDINVLINYKSLFNDLGVSYSTFKDRIEVTHIPTCIYNKYLKNDKQWKEQYLESILTALIHEQIATIMFTRGIILAMPTVLQRLINLEACRGAIKFGDKLTIDECVRHIKKLAECKLPFQCAHGRPTLIPIIMLKDDHNLKKTQPNLEKLK